MPDLITNPTSRATRRRAQIVSEAVVSAYIREIMPSRRPPARVAVRHVGQTCPGVSGAARWSLGDVPGRAHRGAGPRWRLAPGSRGGGRRDPARSGRGEPPVALDQFGLPTALPKPKVVPALPACLIGVAPHSAAGFSPRAADLRRYLDVRD